MLTCRWLALVACRDPFDLRSWLVYKRLEPWNALPTSWVQSLFGCMLISMILLVCKQIESKGSLATS
jgi:hypothetical protein